MQYSASYSARAFAFFALFAMLSPLKAFASDTGKPIVTGLDPTQPVTSVGLMSRATTLTALAHETDRTLVASGAFGRRSELLLALPYRDSLSIDGIGSQNGVGDASLEYRYVLSSSKARFAQMAGLGLSLASGSATFSSGQTQLAPAYAFSYHIARRLTFITESRYSFALSTKEGFPQLRGLDVTPTILASLSRRGVYAAFSTDIQGVRGAYHFTGCESTLRLGAVFSRRLNFSIYYTVPTSNMTYNHILHVSYGLSLTIQRP